MEDEEGLDRPRRVVEPAVGVMCLTKRKQPRCMTHGRDCTCPYWFFLKRQRITTGVNGETVALPGGRIRVALEIYFAPRRLRGKGTLSDAKTLHGQFVTDVDINGKYHQWREHRAGRLAAAGLTWGALVDHHVENYLRPRHQGDVPRAVRYRYDKVKEWIGPERLVRELTMRDALTFLEALQRRGASKPYIRSYWGAFLAMVNRAVEWKLIPAPPFDTRAKAIREIVPRASEIEHRDRRLRPGEEEALNTFLDNAIQTSHRMQLLADIIQFVLSLGYRRGTLRKLQFRDVEWHEGPYGTLRVPGHKMKGRRQSIKRLTPATRAILERRRQIFVALGVYGPECYVFGKTSKQGNKGKPVVLGDIYVENDFITAGWRVARRRAGLDCSKEQGLHLHDLRAEAACRLYEATNGDARRVMHFLDHRSLDETQKYLDRLVPQTEQETADIMATFERVAGVNG